MLPVPPRRRGRTLTAAVTLAAVATLGAAPAAHAVAPAPAPGWSAAGWTAPTPDRTFHRLATYPVFQNRPAGAALADPTVAEISAVSEDGKTFVHTDALARRIGFVDITDPANPVGAGTLDLAADLGVAAHAEPTSVAIVGGYVLVVVDTSPSFTAPSGVLVVVDLATHAVVRTLDLGGQPDSIALSPDKTHAAIAIENQRDEELKPAGAAKKGDLPQLPGGFVQLVDLPSKTDPAGWSLRKVDLTEAALAVVDTPSDPEPEYVAINPAGTTVALTLQENNGIVLIDIASGAVTSVFNAGSVAVSGIDVAKDGVINQTGSIPATPREPDAIAWLDATHVATANEGDWKGGTRGWSVFDTATGLPVWDAGNSLEHLAVRTGLHSEDRAGKKGVEIEGLAVATLGGTPYAFVGSERSNFVAVYDVSNPLDPAFVQVLATTNGPEGILPVPSRDLLLVSSETDDATKNVRSSVSVFGRGTAFASAPATFPSVVSADDAGSPIGWGALGALTPDRSDATHLWSATDAAYTDTRLLSLDVSKTPAVIDRAVRVTEGGTGITLDVEGIASRPTGGFWLGVEGATGAANQLVRTGDDGVVAEHVALPASVTAGLDKWGIEGVTTTTDAAGEHVWVALQRGLSTDPGGLAGFARLGRYDVATQAWTWFGYPLETTSVSGDWLGLSEVVAVDDDTLAVIERDKLNGPAAAVKRIYTVDIPADPAPGEVAPLTKKLAHDVLPDLRATAGWTQEKLEGLTIGIDGQVYAITDNDGVLDATGETVLLRLGSKGHVFGAAPTSTALVVTGPSTATGTQMLTATVTPAAAGEVTFRDGTSVLATAPVTAGVATATVVLGAGSHSVTASFVPSSSEDWTASSSAATALTIAKDATTTALAVTGVRAYGASQTLTATVSPSSATGSVTFRDGTRVLATAPVAGGRASATAVLGVGTHSLTATFVASGTAWAGSSSSSVAVQVARSGSATKVSLANRSTYGKAAKATVTVTGTSAAPAGAVQVREGRTTLATGRLVVSARTGKATVTLPAALAVGKHALTVVFPGTTTVAGSSATTSLTVGKAKPKVAISASSWTVKKNARPVVTVTVRNATTTRGTGATGTVTVSVNGKKVASKVVSGGRVVVRLPKLTRSSNVTATYSGSSSYLRATATHKVRVR
ncbi:MAG: esterase-like activity of phytase family protein [Brevundimonas sp.]